MAKKKKESKTFIKKLIINTLQTNKNSLNQKQISWAIDLKGSEYTKLISRCLKKLKDEHSIVELSNYKYKYNFN